MEKTDDFKRRYSQSVSGGVCGTQQIFQSEFASLLGCPVGARVLSRPPQFLNSTMRSIAILIYLVFSQLSGAQAQTSSSPERWRLVSDIRIGNINGPPDYALTEINDIAVGPNGTMYVVQEMEGLVRVFDTAGVFIRTIGRRGSGPGEFQRPTAIGWLADSLWVVDWVQSRVSLFDAGGEFLDSFRFEGPLLENSSRPTHPSMLLGDGNILAVPSIGSSRSVEKLPILRIDRDGKILGTLGQLDVQRRMGRIETSGPLNINFNYPLPSNSLWDLSPDGSSIAIVHRDVPESGRDNYFHVEKIRSQTDTVFSRRYRFTPKPVPPNAVDSLIAIYSDFFVKARISMSEARRYARDSLKIPAHQVPITDVVVGEAGNVWLRREELGQRSVEWLVIDGSTGDIVATFSAPRELDILHANQNTVWGEIKDEYDVSYVVRLHVR